MKIRRFHSWDVTPQEAILVQERLRAKIIAHGRLPTPKLVAGADAAFDLQTGRVFAAVVVLTFPALEPVETVVHQERLSFPYIPGLLSFREAPALLHTFEKVRHDPDVIFIDGHGLSHPRAAGIACHVGLCLDKPTIGCAKSLLVGTHRIPGLSRGAATSLHDADSHVIGAVVRTRDRVKPVFVSVGHRIGLAQAVRLTLACGKGYRNPRGRPICWPSRQNATPDSWQPVALSYSLFAICCWLLHGYSLSAICGRLLSRCTIMNSACWIPDEERSRLHPAIVGDALSSVGACSSRRPSRADWPTGPLRLAPHSAGKQDQDWRDGPPSACRWSLWLRGLRPRQVDHGRPPSGPTYAPEKGPPLAHRLPDDRSGSDNVGLVLDSRSDHAEIRLANLCAERFSVIRRFGNSDSRGGTPGHLFFIAPER